MTSRSDSSHGSSSGAGLATYRTAPKVKATLRAPGFYPDSDEEDETGGETDQDLTRDLKKLKEGSGLKPRSYQVALLQLAKERNVIICLPTGSGKTFVALQLMKFYLPVAIRERKIIYFLAPSVPLVHQQALYLKSNIYNERLTAGSGVKPFTGCMNVDAWDRSRWIKELDMLQIAVMTPQIFLDLLDHTYITYDNVALLVLDECHHAGKEHPMCKAMLHYQRFVLERGKIAAPRVLGLTATIIRGAVNSTSIINEVSDVESILCAKAVTYHDYEEVLKHSTNAQVEMVQYEGNSILDNTWFLQPLSTLIDELETEAKNLASDFKPGVVPPGASSFAKAKHPLKQFSNALRAVSKVLGELGLYCARLAAILKQAYLAVQVQPEDSITSAFRTRTNSALTMFLSRVERQLNGRDKSVQIRKISPKLKALVDLLLSQNSLNDAEAEDLCAIVFVQRRITCQVLSWFFQDCFKYGGSPYSFIKAAFVIGSSRTTLDSRAARVSTFKQAEVVQGFHQNKFNLVFATSVLEEGLDVPMCNLVVRFDDIANYPSYVQSMGRARKQNARFYVFASTTDYEKYLHTCSNFKMCNAALSSHLRENAIHVDDHEDFLNIEGQDDLIPCYCPEGTATSPRVTASSAVSLIHQYCSQLPSEKLCLSFPTSWWVTREDEKGVYFIGYVKLPSRAAVNHVIEGPPMSTTGLAKRAVFLEACKQLHANGGLDSKLMPVKYPIPKEISSFLMDVECEDDCATRYKWHQKMIPRVLRANIAPGKSFDIYAMHIQPKDPEVLEANSFYQFHKKRFEYGIIVPKNMDMNYCFSIEFKRGDMQISFQKVLLNELGTKGMSTAQFEKIVEFQSTLFKSILNLKLAGAFSSEAACYMIPLRKDENSYEVAWDVMSKALGVKNFDFKKQPSFEEQRLLDMGSVYEDAVVIPYYKSKAEYQQVLHVDFTRTINSNLASDTATTFKNYYKGKYKLELRDEKQPLLKCSEMSSQLNYWLPRYRFCVETKEQRQATLERACEMVPELCNIYPYPSSLFTQARFLPSILHRVWRLKIAEQLKSDVGVLFNWHSAMKSEDIIPTEIKMKIRAGPDGIGDADSLHLSNAPESSSQDLPESVVNQDARNLECFLDHVHPDQISFEDLKRIVEYKRTDTHAFLDNTQRKTNLPSIRLISIDEEQYTVKDLDNPTNFKEIPGPSSHTIMEALTLASSNDSVSLERLECMGDSFLKYIVSVHLFIHYPTKDEGFLTQTRSRFISNKHLMSLGRAIKLPECISGGIFYPLYTWLPPGHNVPEGMGKAAAESDSNLVKFCNSKDHIQGLTPDNLTALKTDCSEASGAPIHTTYEYTRIYHKSVADSMEALIGAYFTNGGQDSALRFMEWAGFKGPVEDGRVISYSRPNQTLANLGIINMHLEMDVLDFIPFIGEVEDLLCYKFKNRWLLVEALTHSSFVASNATRSYERLEFLGDALLDFLVTTHIYHAHIPGKLPLNPGELTDLRSALVNNITFGSLVVRYGLQKYMLFMSDELSKSINSFVEYQELHNHEVTGHFTLLNDLECPVAQNVEVPKALGDLFESIAGAVYLDCGLKLDVMWKIFYRLLKHEIDLFSKKVPKSPIRLLYENFPSAVEIKSLDAEIKAAVPSYQGTLVRIKVNGNAFYGSGPSKAAAKLAAAKYAMDWVHRSLKYYNRGELLLTHI